jgi:hypothetical protein
VDISESAKVLGRRWYIVVPVLAGFVLAAMFVAGRGDPDYRASASMEVLPRYKFGVNTHSLGGQITLSSVTLIVDTAEVRAEFEAAGWSPDYTVTVDDKDPLMLVEVSDRDPVFAQATVDELILRVGDELDAMQAQVRAPQSEWFEIEVTHTSPPP